MKTMFFGTSCAVPTADNGHTSFLIAAGERLLLVDASGNPVQAILKAGQDPTELDALVLTHYHADHMSGLPALLQTLGCMKRSKDLTIISDETTRSKARRVMEVYEITDKSLGFSVPFASELHFPGGNLTLTPGRHSVPSSMIRVQELSAVLFYTSDTSYNQEVSEIARGCSLLIHEATTAHETISDLEKDGHSSAYQAGLTAAASNASVLFLCHVWENRYPDRESIVSEARRGFGGTVILPRTYQWYPV